MLHIRRIWGHHKGSCSALHTIFKDMWIICLGRERARSVAHFVVSWIFLWSWNQWCYTLLFCYSTAIAWYYFFSTTIISYPSILCPYQTLLGSLELWKSGFQCHGGSWTIGHLRWRHIWKWYEACTFVIVASKKILDMYNIWCRKKLKL